MTEPEPTEPTSKVDTDALPTAIDWSVLNEPGVADVLEIAARKVGEGYGNVTTPDDMRQEGAIWLATNANQVREYLSSPNLGERALYTRLRSRLIDKIRTTAEAAARAVALPEPPE